MHTVLTFYIVTDQKIKTMIPKDGMNQEWDSINQQIKDAEKQFESHLKVVKKELKCSTVVYRDMGKDLYQMEVPKNIKVPQNWLQTSMTSVRTELYASQTAYTQPFISYRKSIVIGTMLSRTWSLNTKS